MRSFLLGLLFSAFCLVLLPAAAFAQMGTLEGDAATSWMDTSLVTVKTILLASIERAAPVCFTILAVTVGVTLVMRLVRIVLH